jgi:23S rRNA (adenine2503-C2)-methyltransferase
MQILEERIIPGMASLFLGRSSGPDNEASAVEFLETKAPGSTGAVDWWISVQKGCPVGCRFCDGGSLPWGNLRAEDILAQIRCLASRRSSEGPAPPAFVNLRLSRVGEPSLNPDTLKVLRLLAREFPGPDVIPCLSTAAPKSPVTRDFFEELLAIKNLLYPNGRFDLQFSAHSLDERRRQELIPIKKWSLDEISEYGSRFVGPSDRKVALAFALPEGASIDPRRLSALFDPERFRILITPVYAAEAAKALGIARPWHRVPAPIRACAAGLRRRGFDVEIRADEARLAQAAASCGRLWSQALRRRAATALKNIELERQSYVTARTISSKALTWAKEIKGFERQRAKLDVSQSALLVMDMQELFLDSGSEAYMPSSRAILRNAARLRQAFAKSGRPVYFSFHAHDDPAKDGGLMSSWWRMLCRAGSPESRIAPALDPDLCRTFRKCRYSPFSHPGLEDALRLEKIRQLVVAGVATHLCVDSAVRDAFDLGFQPFVVGDATASQTEELHLAALRTLSHGFAGILWTDAVMNILGGKFHAQDPTRTL